MDHSSSDIDAAVAKHLSGEVDEAAALYRAILAREPKHPQALHMLGTIAFQKNNPSLALNLIEASLAVKADAPMAWHNRSLVLRALERREEALSSARQALTLSVNYPEAWAMAGMLLRELGQTERAKECHWLALTLRPNDPKLKSDYAIDLLALNDVAGAYKAVSTIDSKSADVIPITLANILKAAGYPERALPFMQKARSLLPDNEEIGLNEASALLQLGDYEEAWPLWEKRPDLDQRFRAIPLWRGEPTERLLIYEDQGIGDAVQALRYLPLVIKLAHRPMLFLHADLERLATQNFPSIPFVASDQAIPLVDCRVRLMSLPALFKTGVSTIPRATTYLDVSDPSPHLPIAPRKPCVGLVWGGNPKNVSDARRSLPGAAVEQICRAGAGHLVSFQKGPHAGEVDLQNFGVIDAGPHLDSFASTAALMKTLDLMITTCTSTAHLAGALGVPTWLILCFDPHWVWLLGREDSPWYQSIKIFRQSRPGDWSEVIEKVVDQLNAFKGGDRSVLSIARTNDLYRQNPLALPLFEG